ncbi:hypothetical protein CCHR01_18882 [Colletotrichum chrysophilum]|uniref:Uncharacterized protein n=1 Tax=Colletotrichum chrysophilum TaxID=1836956 RepID=A0AAD9A1K8_9PEZI|nr:hypothetical protein CCHR01_18882 [Colletotrichum chrysophilum]
MTPVMLRGVEAVHSFGEEKKEKEETEERLAERVSVKVVVVVVGRFAKVDRTSQNDVERRLFPAYVLPWLKSTRRGEGGNGVWLAAANGRRQFPTRSRGIPRVQMAPPCHEPIAAQTTIAESLSPSLGRLGNSVIQYEWNEARKPMSIVACDIHSRSCLHESPGHGVSFGVPATNGIPISCGRQVEFLGAIFGQLADLSWPASQRSPVPRPPASHGRHLIGQHPVTRIKPWMATCAAAPWGVLGIGTKSKTFWRRWLAASALACLLSFLSPTFLYTAYSTGQQLSAFLEVWPQMGPNRMQKMSDMPEMAVPPASPPPPGDDPNQRHPWDEPQRLRLPASPICSSNVSFRLRDQTGGPSFVRGGGKGRRTDSQSVVSQAQPRPHDGLSMSLTSSRAGHGAEADPPRRLLSWTALIPCHCNRSRSREAVRVNTAMRRRKRCRRCNSQSMRFVAAHGGISPKVGMAKEGQQRGIEHRADDEAAGGVE